MKRIFLIVVSVLLLFPVFGQENIDSFRQEGIASWYGIEFAGKPTASGEIFNPDDMTAAHPKLPFGTFLRVTNTHNGKQVIVRVNDRGPFAAARIIDLSERAAEQLDMIITGTAPVIVEKIDLLAVNDRVLSVNNSLPEVNNRLSAVDNRSLSSTPPVENVPAIQAEMNDSSPIQPIQEVSQVQAVPRVQSVPNQSVMQIKPVMPALEIGKSYRIQVGAYKNAKYAVEAFETLKNAGLTPSYERYNDLYRVVIAQIPTNNVQLTINTLEKAGFVEILVKEER